VENKKITLGGLLDIEGAFNSTSHIIIEAAKRQWNGNTLGKRKLTAILAGENVEGSVARGCQQGGILLPLP
jgi:hypothetical protein